MRIVAGSSSDHVLRILRQYSDRELRIDDLVSLSGGQHKRDAIVKSLEFLVGHGAVVKVREGRAAWFAIASAQDLP